MTMPVYRSFTAAQSNSKTPTQHNSKTLTHGQLLNKIYSLPAPVRTFPLPAFIPHNPISIFQIIFTWISQVINQKTSHITPPYQGALSLETRSVHITDSRAIRGLWEQGFYGKGSLSRSEPAWLDGERARRENKNALTSEEFTRKRRDERQKLKWDRARKERIAIDQQLLEEASSSSKTSCQYVHIISQESSKLTNEIPMKKLIPPVGPMELLSLPNSQSDLDNLFNKFSEYSVDTKQADKTKDIPMLGNPSSSINPQASAPPNQGTLGTKSRKASNVIEQLIPRSTLVSDSERRQMGIRVSDCILQNKSEENIIQNPNLDGDSHARFQKPEISKKITVDSGRLCTNDTLSEFPSKDSRDTQLAPRSERNIFGPSDELRFDKNINLAVMPDEELTAIKNEEHLQLTLEEAFFLSYALGCLLVLDPVTRQPMTNQSLFKRLKLVSPFPTKDIQIKSLDNIFITNYVVYHHFRSLGWVVRSGIKFSVDYLLYNRGPVFSHAEFSVLILPSYSDPYWSSTDSLTEYSRRKQHRSWAWMACINRVISQVKKTLILCYVDIPPPLTDEDEEHMNLDVKLARYKIREFVISRFLVNRMRS